jgi:2-oxoglutarate ferredoxin oxidoreductase subunit beta
METAAETAPPAKPNELTRKDFVSSAEVRWCPGCGDYAILNSIQSVLPELGIPKEKIVFVSGIGCSSRFPYYLDTYGFHTVHGRAPTVATGIKVANPELSVWVITGDGDALSIGGNHFMHAMRRNLNLNVILFNNRIYGLTKGQFSPTSPLGQVTKTSPFGTIEQPVNPVTLAIASQATFVARTVDTQPAHMKQVFLAAARHPGVSFVEVFQNCVIFNDNAWKDVSAPDVRSERLLNLVAGKPLLFGAKSNKGLRASEAGRYEVVTLGEHGVEEKDLVVHDPGREDATHAWLLSQMNYPEMPTAIGVFRSVKRPVYDMELEEQIKRTTAKQGRRNLHSLLRGGSFWEVADSGKDIKMTQGGKSRLEDEEKIADERTREALRDINNPLNLALREPIGHVFYEYGYQRGVTISPTDSINTAISLFKAQKVETLMVMMGGKPVGTISQREIVQSVALSTMDRDTTAVSTVMRPSFDVLDDTHTVADAINVLSISSQYSLPLKLRKGGYGVVNFNQILSFLHEKMVDLVAKSHPKVAEKAGNADVEKTAET